MLSKEPVDTAVWSQKPVSAYFSKQILAFEFIMQRSTQQTLPKLATSHPHFAPSQTQHRGVGPTLDERPRKHGAFTRCCFNVGPPSSTLVQHWNSIGWMHRVCWRIMFPCQPQGPDAVYPRIIWIRHQSRCDGRQFLKPQTIVEIDEDHPYALTSHDVTDWPFLSLGISLIPPFYSYQHVQLKSIIQMIYYWEYWYILLYDLFFWLKYGKCFYAFSMLSLCCSY